jgi:hypothetical protein
VPGAKRTGTVNIVAVNGAVRWMTNSALTILQFSSQKRTLTDSQPRFCKKIDKAVAAETWLLKR